MKSIALLFCLFSWMLLSGVNAEQLNLPLEKDSLKVIYGGQEIMHYSLSWSGGIKIGDLLLKLEKTDNPAERIITARVTDYGLFKLFYPVDDIFTTVIGGILQLPLRYTVHQKEGRGREYYRYTVYDQQAMTALYHKNDNPEEKYEMGGPAYNEFSSFYITRSLALDPARQEIVPTFVDKKRHKVAVKVFGIEPHDSLFGRVDTIKVMPKMHFKGLYDKDGDTIFWLTNDVCRVPVEINAKILIGSLVATLDDYQNPSCLLKKVADTKAPALDGDML